VEEKWHQMSHRGRVFIKHGKSVTYYLNGPLKRLPMYLKTENNRVYCQLIPVNKLYNW
jgi:hypothetical protein